jgi:hypothetical protein
LVFPCTCISTACPIRNNEREIKFMEVPVHSLTTGSVLESDFWEELSVGIQVDSSSFEELPTNIVATKH